MPRLVVACRFLLVDPPTVEIDAFSYRYARLAETVPISDVEVLGVPVRHHVPVPQQQPIQRPRGDAQRVTIVGGDNLLNHGVDRWAADARNVGTTLRFRPGARPVIAQFAAGNIASRID